MRTKQIIPGIKNSHRIRVIINGVGFYTTVKDMTEMPFNDQRVAVWQTLEVCVREGIKGLSQRVKLYDHSFRKTEVDVQVNL
jgi:hypothetical protein